MRGRRSLIRSLFVAGGGLPLPLFTPASVMSATLVRWYARGGVGLWADAGKTVPAVVDEAVYVWEDRAGNNDATQATLENRFILRNVDDELLLEGDGARSFLLGDLSALTAATLFISLKVKNVPPTSDKSALWDLSSVSEDSHYTWTDSHIYEGAGTETRFDLGIPDQDLTELHVYSIVTLANDWRAYHNGTLIHSAVSNTVSFRATTRLGVSKSGLYYFDGYVKELVIFDGALSPADMASMNVYMGGGGSPFLSGVLLELAPGVVAESGTGEVFILEE